MANQEWQRKIEEIIEVVERAGEILLKSGAEIFRIEDTLKRMLESIPGVSDSHVLALPSSITISIYFDKMPYSYTYTVKGSRINLDKIDKVNQLSRDFVPDRSGDYAPYKKRLKEIDESVIYREWQRIVSASLVCCAYVWLVGGSIKEGIISMLAGFMVVIITRKMQKQYVNFFLVDFLGAFISGVIIYMISIFIKDFKVGLCIMGSIMPLVPGIALTNSIRDSMAGNFMTGVSRLLEVLLAAMALALGVLVSYKLMQWGFNLWL